MRYLTILPIVLILATSCVQEDLSEFVPVNEIEQPVPPVVVDPYGDDEAIPCDGTCYTGEYQETEQVTEAEARQDEATQPGKGIHNASHTAEGTHADLTQATKSESPRAGQMSTLAAPGTGIQVPGDDARIPAPISGEKGSEAKPQKSKQ